MRLASRMGFLLARATQVPSWSELTRPSSRTKRHSEAAKNPPRADTYAVANNTGAGVEIQPTDFGNTHSVQATAGLSYQRLRG